MELIILGILIAIYTTLLVLMLLGGIKMYKKLKNEEFTAYQQGRLNVVSNNRARYEDLKAWYKALNACPFEGRVLNMRGEVLDPGFRKVTPIDTRRKK